MQKITCQQIKDQFPKLFSASQGPLTNLVSGVSAPENVRPGTLIFLLNEKFLQAAADSKASLVMAPAKFQDKVKTPAHQTWLFGPNPELAMALVKNHFFFTTPYRAPAAQKIHPRASVDPSAHLHESVIVAAGASIGAGVKIGAGSFVGAGAVIEPDVTIGENTTLHPLSYIGHSSVIGSRCEVKPQACVGSEGYGYAHDEQGNHYRIPHSGRVILQDDVHIGAGTCIDRGTIEDSVIAQGTKIDNQCHLGHNSVVGRNSLITAKFGMAGSSKIGDNFISGGGASVTGHIEIASGVQVAGLSGVTKSLTEPGQYGGFPLETLQDYLKTKAAIVQLKDMRKQLKQLVKDRSDA